MKEYTATLCGLRGPTDHCIRDQIVSAANEHFSHYGYGKTTVSDLAKAIGFSKAYIYKFFDSKQAIGEAICSRCMNVALEAVGEAMRNAGSAAEKFCRLFDLLVGNAAKLFVNERKLYDIAVYAAAERWPSSLAYEQEIRTLLRQIIQEGRENGEFEQQTPLDECCQAVYLVMQPFINPLLLQHHLDLLPQGPEQLSRLVLRSLKHQDA
ncbi:Transcriptional regulator, TetR family [Sodalis praecaptivus]|uniref:Transcriptional regulator, TetR family n=1 Tax=Sodalis praecaptivus TaxID=1239307 RepID=W0HZY8_9GAMM|nr:TetR/AcrR family transcriptional regulator [Sodalis praecaptivus]AHF78077.1 Transcriptional regulator, TetR family [Sodalis praecaptivus]